MSIGSETGIEESEDCNNSPLDSADYTYICWVILWVLIALVGLFLLIFFLITGDANENLKKITPVVQPTSKK